MKWLKVENNKLVSPHTFDIGSGLVNCHLNESWMIKNGFRQWTEEEIEEFNTRSYSSFNKACSNFREICAEIGEMIGDSEFKGGFDEIPLFYNNSSYKTDKGMQLAIALDGCKELCEYEAAKLGIGSPEWWYKCWNISTDGGGGGTNLNSDLVKLGILPKQVSEYTDADIGSTILIPYTDESGKILLNNGCIEFEVVGVNHHTNSDYKQTITIMPKMNLRYVAFDAREPDNPMEIIEDEDWTWYPRAELGNNRWKYSNIRQWLNSSGDANAWYVPQHEYDAPPIYENLEDGSDEYAKHPGFLKGFSPEVLEHFTDIVNNTAVPKADGNGSEITVDKVFLPSCTEIGWGLNDGISEGTHMSYRFPLDKPIFDEESDVAWDMYLLRSPYQNDTDGTSIRIINSNEQEIGSSDASHGILPFIVLH